MSALISWCVGGATIVHQAGLRRPCLVTAFCFLLLRTATGPATHTAGLYSATAALTPLDRLGSQIIPTWNQAAGIFLVYSGTEHKYNPRQDSSGATCKRFVA